MKNYISKVKRNKKKNSVSIELEGQLNVANIAEIQKDLLKAVKDVKVINLTISKVDDADLALIQFLKSFEIKCFKNDLKLTIKLDLNQDINTLFERAELISILNIN